MQPQPSAFIQSLPKAELHLHLEGSIDPATLLELRQLHGKDATLAEIEELYRYEDFTGFLNSFKNITADLQGRVETLEDDDSPPRPPWRLPYTNGPRF